jgi:hypothetical protein
MRVYFLCASLLVAPAFAQVVQIGPTDPDYCYRIEKIQPNLELRGEAHVFGSVRDQTTAPLKNLPVELRKYISQRKQINLRVVSTDGTGHFDLGIVKPGAYRLLASPHRGFKQPSALQCQKGNRCNLEITLEVNPTDRLDASCPIR